MLRAAPPPAQRDKESTAVWRALANPIRRRLLERLATGPKTTGELAADIKERSRFSVMQHLGVLTESGLVLARRRGRQRFNYLNPVPLRRWYEEHVTPLADQLSADLLSLERHVEDETHLQRGEPAMKDTADQARTVRIETELSFGSSRERVFRALTDETREWFPATYGEDRVIDVVVEPRVGGRHYEDWGSDRGYLYGFVTEYDPPRRLATRGRLMPGTILDTEYELSESDGRTVLSMTRVAFGPMTEDEAASVRQFGDLANFEEALRACVERPE